MKRYGSVLRWGSTLIIYYLLMIMHSCQQTKNGKKYYCTESDFKTMEKIDIHCHVSTKRFAFMEQALEDNFRILTMNTDASDDITQTIEEQEKLAIHQQNEFPGHLAYLTTFSLDGWNNDNWQQKTIDKLAGSFEKGAIGVKVWKNIGMEAIDKNGKFIMIDDPKFDSVFNYIEKKGVPVCGHLGEPKNCWLPIDEMTVNSDKHYFKEHPEYYMYLLHGFPTYEDQVRARDKLLQKHPNLHFMGAHLGSLEWSIDELAKHFNRYPNMTVDCAARICHLEKQAQKDWQNVYDFFIKYQDRIIYGTDEGDWTGSDTEPWKLKENIHSVWVRDWKFFTTDEIMTSWEVDGEFKGLKLPREVIEKIYYKNALKWFPGILK